jgi:hypothetical protein
MLYLSIEYGNWLESRGEIMYLKRFIQLLVVFIISSILWVWLYQSNFLGNQLASFIVAMAIGYGLLVLPLVVLTLMKGRRKAESVGSYGEAGRLTKILNELPGYIVFTWQDEHANPATAIMSFVQSSRSENVFYMVTEPQSTKAHDLLRYQQQVSFTTWFNELSQGMRISSNKARVQTLQNEKAQLLVETEPNILNLHENAANMMILKMTVDSVLYEDFKGKRWTMAFK